MWGVEGFKPQTSMLIELCSCCMLIRNLYLQPCGMLTRLGLNYGFCHRRGRFFLTYFNICRRSVLERKLASSDVSEEEQINLLKDLERTETQYMRLKRHKICVEDFDLLTIIGRGAFGEVGNRND